MRNIRQIKWYWKQFFMYSPLEKKVLEQQRQFIFNFLKTFVREIKRLIWEKRSDFHLLFPDMYT